MSLRFKRLVMAAVMLPVVVSLGACKIFTLALAMNVLGHVSIVARAQTNYCVHEPSNVIVAVTCNLSYGNSPMVSRFIMNS